ncbi:hypothetical protein K1T71_011309 [Dendrolimus kikuchii]|uniref:Uncharacterized protein n=1 Tax=Dendrolimus kikuchii TaxID=765133 RepID=A0ACC1CNF2_9NEOP|nr:hypothetical protein K1T71_011309 [Dendrolimus kikuchii]
MQSINPHPILKFNPDTLVTLRRQYNYEKPGEMDAAIDVLEDWIKKQEHFTKKEYPREYLERAIILLKGSVERAKLQIERICTMRTLMSKFFEIDMKYLEEYKDKFTLVMLPKMTKDHIRVFTNKMLCPSSELNQQIFFAFYMLGVLQWEHLKRNDYCDGVTFCLDYRGINFIEFMAGINLVDTHHIATIAVEGFCLRIKGIHILTESNSVNLLVALCRQIFSKKVADRVRVHKSLDSLYEVVPREMLPSDLGGDEDSSLKLRDEWFKLLKEKDNFNYLKEMCNARTNEALRQSGKFNEEYMGMAGSFRSLNVD